MADDDGNRILVAVRCRPASQRELQKGAACGTDALLCSSNTVVLRSSGLEDSDAAHQFEQKEFGYDRVFGDSSTQEEVYDAIGEPLVRNAMNAYNGCIFAYGQTGSGKTHSVVGDLTSEHGTGIQPRACKRIFELLSQRKSDNESFEATCLATYMEIYNEKIFDLLSAGHGSKDELNVRLHPTLGPIVPNLVECPIQIYSDTMELFDYGAKRRAVGATQMNEVSSRSHAIFTLQIRTSMRTSAGSTVESQAKIHFVDLAGSERQKKTQATGARLKEGIGINQSLSTLSRVISELATKGSKNMPPFRESKLTLLLKDALMGNSRTALLACIGPAKANISETIGTLEFAARCKLVQTKARKNEESRATVIQKLTVEKEAIQEQLRLEKSKSEDLCRQLQMELEKVEFSERSTEEALAEKRAIEERLKELELQNASLEQAFQEKASQEKAKQEKASQEGAQEVSPQRAATTRWRVAGTLAAKTAQLEKTAHAKTAALEERERMSQELRAKMEAELQAQRAREQECRQQMEDLRALQASWAVDQQEIQTRREEQQQHREEELQRLGMHVTGLDPRDLASAPRLVNLHPDPALKGCLVYYLPVGEAVMGSDEDKCRVRLTGAGIGPEACVVANADNVSLSVKPVDSHCLLRVNGVLVDTAGKALADGDRLAVGRAVIFKVHIPRDPQDKGETDGTLEFDSAMEEIAACAQVDPLWENGLRKAMHLVRTDYGESAANALLARARRASEVIGTANDLLKQTAPGRRAGVELFEMSMMFDSRGLPEVCVVARAEPRVVPEEPLVQTIDDWIEDRPAPARDHRRRRGPGMSMGIWDLRRFEEERLPLLEEGMREPCRRPWAKIEKDEETGGTTLYTIRVKIGGSETVLTKRLKDFQGFDKILRSRSDVWMQTLPQLPDSSSWLGVREALGFRNSSKERRTGLQKYIDFLVANLAPSELEALLQTNGSFLQAGGSFA